MDEYDAAFVEVIHTNADVRDLGMGIRQKIGDLDLYLNGGMSQVGCCYQWSKQQKMTPLLKFPCIGNVLFYVVKYYTNIILIYQTGNIIIKI